MESEQAQVNEEGAPAADGRASSEVYQLPVLDTSHAPASTAEFFAAFFAAKNTHSPDETMRFFSRDLATYTDATLGLALDGFDGLHDLFARYMPDWGDGRSYPVRILGGPSSAVVAFTDTPELFGGELHLLGAVDLAEGKIIRWVDYWDSSGFERPLFDRIRTPDDVFPSDFKDDAVAEGADAGLGDAARGLHAALSGGARALFAYDAVYEDMALRTQIVGRSAIGRYLGRTLELLPFGPGSGLSRVLGGGTGGGFEWVGAQATTGVRRGITALELDARGSRISRLTVCYDGRRLTNGAKERLVGLSMERP